MDIISSYCPRTLFVFTSATLTSESLPGGQTLAFSSRKTTTKNKNNKNKIKSTKGRKRMSGIRSLPPSVVSPPRPQTASPSSCSGLPRSARRNPGPNSSWSHCIAMTGLSLEGTWEQGHSQCDVTHWFTDNGYHIQPEESPPDRHCRFKVLQHWLYFSETAVAVGY